VTTLFDTLLSIVWKSVTLDEKFFNDHIQPVYTQMRTIHSDYSTVFATVADSLRTRRNLEAAVTELERERPKHLADRIEVRSLMTELERLRLNPRRSTPTIEALHEFVKAVDSYLVAASPLAPRETFYEHFIKTFGRLLATGQDPYNYTYAVAGHEHDLPDFAAHMLEEAVQHSMPEAWERFVTAYATVRAMSL
jgi:hypothetical protein